MHRDWTNELRVLSWSTRLNQVAVALAALLTIAIHAGVHAAKWPHFEGWWAGFDQTAYLTAARAWAAGDLTPSLHHYPSGYALLAAPFVPLLAAEPFAPVDLVSALLALALLVALARRLTPHWAFAPAAAALAFAGATASSRAAVAVWGVPWSTTPATPLVLCTIWLALRWTDRASAADAFAAGMSGALIAAFRPTDAAVLLGCVGLGLAASALAKRLTPRQFAFQAGAFTAGSAISLMALAAIHVAIHGAAAGEYLAGSASIGFEPGLIPQRWVLLALDPRPVFGAAAGPGLLVAFPWILPGVAGMAACLWLGERRLQHAIACAAVAATWLLYLAYRDLHPPSLWRFYNYHYFKWTQLVLAFYAALWLRALCTAGQRRVAIFAALAAAALLTPWRAELRRLDSTVVAVSHAPDGRALIMAPFAFESLTDAAIISTAGSWDGVPGALANLATGDAGQMRLGAYPLLGEVLILPLRRLPPGPAALVFDPSIPFGSEAAVQHARLALRLGLP